ncbi:MAG: tripartite tricarboxylate transporter substrate binding protein [Polaromonas sp.]|nr:tripartite tricarboxylate transporter substrate binding protein [Polaromonas sp.]
MNKVIFAAALGIASCTLASLSNAQEAYPARPITIVVPFGAGSGSDIGARLIGQKLGEGLGQSVVIDNKPGANGSIGASYVAKAKADGYTLLIGTNSTHGANPGLLKEMRYDPVKDFAPVNRIAIYTSIIVANPAVPVKNMRELIALGKTQELTLATGNASGVVQSETLARYAKWKPLLRVPFKSNPPAMTEVMAGRVQLMFSDIASVQAQVKSGALRALAVTSKDRSALMPDLPTFIESGVPDYDLSGWVALFAPAGTPPAVVNRLNAEVTRILNLPDVRSKLLDLGAEPGPMAVPQVTAWVQKEVTTWTQLVKDAGIQPE